MTKPKKNQYRIQYIDNIYQIVDWTKAELKEVAQSMNDNKVAVLVGDDLFKCLDIRAIVYMPPVPEPTKEEKLAQAEQQLSEWGFVDPETALWLKENGFDLTKGVN